MSEGKVLTFKCYGCKEMLPSDSFSKDSSRAGKRNVAGKCKKCISTVVKQYDEDRPGRRTAYSKGHYEKTKEKHKAAMVLWRSLNKDKVLQYWHNYKAKIRDNGPIDKDINIIVLVDRDDGICQICKEPCLDDPSIDHIKPISKGGTHTWDNVQLAHKICNLRKGASYVE